jgi:RNA polymerase sigma factor (sigma-70 family)
MERLDETKLVELFKEQEILKMTDEKYLANRDVIMNVVLKSLPGKLQACQSYWSRTYRLDADECESLMWESVLTAIDTYKISRGKCKFTSFLWTVTAQIFKNYLSKIYAQKRTPRMKQGLGLKPVFAPIYSLSEYSDRAEDEGTQTLEDTLTDTVDIEQIAHDKLLVSNIYRQATKKQQRILKRLFVGKSYSEVGKVLHMSPSDICNLVKQLREQHKELA